MYKKNGYYYYSSLIGLGQNVYFWIDILDRHLDGDLPNGGGVQTGSGGVGGGIFPYRCSDGSRTFCLLWADIALAMSVQNRQNVRKSSEHRI